MNIIQKTILALLITSLIFIVIVKTPKFGSAPAGQNATVATTTLSRTVGTSQTLLFATSSPACTSRIISTTNGAIYLTFTDAQGITPTAITGHLQLGSTTVAYDSGLYGCDAVRAISATGGNVTVTVSEGR